MMTKSPERRKAATVKRHRRIVDRVTQEFAFLARRWNTQFRPSPCLPCLGAHAATHQAENISWIFFNPALPPAERSAWIAKAFASIPSMKAVA